MSYSALLLGFYKAPISKAALVGYIGSFVALCYPFRKLQSLFSCNYDLLFDKNQIWRLPLSKLVFSDPKDLFLAIILIYNFKKFERRYGSRKFMSCISGVFLLSQALEFFSILILSRYLDIKEIPTGPISIIFSFFVPFYLDVPRITRATFLGIPVTGKSIAYFGGLQIASAGTEYLLLAAIGLASGIMYRYNFLYVKAITGIPIWYATFVHRHTSGWIEGSPPTIPASYGATLDLQWLEEQEQLEAVLWPELPSAQNPVLPRWPDSRGQQRQLTESPPEQLVGTLMEMGFARERVLEALSLSSNDITRATNYLLSS